MEADGRKKRQTDDIYYSSANEEYRYKRDVSNETRVYGWVLPSVDLSVHSSYIQWVQWPQKQNMSLVETFPLLGFQGKLAFLFWALRLLAYQIWVKLAASCRENGGNYRWRILFLWGVEKIFATIHDGNHTKAATANKANVIHTPLNDCS